MTASAAAVAPGAAPAAGRLRPWQWGALLVLCLALYLPGFFTLPPFDRDEARFAQATRQMVASGDYVTIRFQDEARLKKPVGIYWLQAASVQLLGPADGSEIWPYRVPSLLGAMLAVLATAWAGTRLFGPGVGFGAALVLAGCVVLGVEARMAKTDAVLLATVVLAQGALARLWLDRASKEPPGWGLPLLFWAALGVSLLIKGPIGPMVSALTILTLGVSERRFGWLGRLRPGLGLAVVVVVAAPWLIAISIATHGQFFAESLGHDLLGKVASGQEAKGLPPGYFLGTFWITFAPFALPAALAVPWVWANRREPGVMFCLAWLIPTWLLFEAVPTKLLHYTLPTFPAIALLTVRAAQDHFGRSEAAPRWRLFGAAALAAGAAALVLTGGVATLPWLIDHRLLTAGLVAAVAVPVMLAVAGLWCWQRRERPALALALAALVLWSAATFQGVLPQLDGLWLSRQAALQVTALRPCATTTVVTADYSEPSLVFLLGTDTRTAGGDIAADHLRADPACGLALVEARAEPLFRHSLNGLAVRPVATLTGFNYSRGRRQTLTLYRAEP